MTRQILCQNSHAKLSWTVVPSSGEGTNLNYSTHFTNFKTTYYLFAFLPFCLITLLPYSLIAFSFTPPLTPLPQGEGKQCITFLHTHLQILLLRNVTNILTCEIENFLYTLYICKQSSIKHNFFIIPKSLPN